MDDYKELEKPIRYRGKIKPPRYKREFVCYEVDQCNERWLDSAHEEMIKDGKTDLSIHGTVLYHTKSIEESLYQWLLTSQVKVRGLLIPNNHHEWPNSICLGFEINSPDEILFRIQFYDIIGPKIGL